MFQKRLLWAVAPLLLAATARAEINFGPWTFHDQAFADEAIQMDEGSVRLFGTPAPANLQEALTGFSPATMVSNMGINEERANYFQLNFTDMFIVNDAGDDLVFFDGRYSIEPFEISVRPVGGVFTDFLTFAAEEFINTGMPGPFEIDPPEAGWIAGLPINLDDYGLAASSAVDAIRFRSLEGPDGVQGDPVMAGALNVPEPATIALLAVGAVAVLRRRRTAS